VNDDQVLDAVRLLARLEGIICALESAHAVAWLVQHREEIAGTSVVLTLSGRGDKDAETIAERLGFLEGESYA
jgi:tryptophan synthase beta subunit